jgi:hypothetical protein
MKTQRFLMGLTVLNMILLIVLLLSRTQLALAYTRAPVLRGSALEIVDEKGRVRASIKVQPAETFEPTGRKYPETVVFRLIDPRGRPEVKIGASEDGGGLSLIGDSDATRVLLLMNKGGGERLIAP